ncbi:OmpL47-type beta-barrel domain-containing protein, partial [Clostridium sp.]|uniref:OmpL47-type beta-barrel domain-containing protein n=1 Tax=Clostridium sp. TaxID=1506 RepID=UPI002FDD5287
KVGEDYGAFKTNESRIAKLNGKNYWYWTRVPYFDRSYVVCNVSSDGSLYNYGAYTESVGVRAALNLKSDILLEYTENDNFVYPKDINKIYNADEVKKYGSWANGYYGFDAHNFQHFDATGKWASFGNVIDEDEIAQKYIFPNGRVVTIDKYGMVNDYKTFDTTQPATVPMDGTSIKNMFLGYIDGIGLVPMMEKTDGCIWYIDNDNQARMLPIERSEYKDTLIYHKVNNKSDKFLFVKNDGKLSYFNKDRFEVETKINMNDVEKVLPATNVTDDLFLMKDGTIKNLDGTAVDFQGKKLVKMLSNRYLIMDDNFIYTMQGMSIKNTNTLATLYNKAVNDLLWLKNGKVMRADNSGNMSFLNDVNGKLVKDLVKVDETGTFILMKDNTTKSYGSVSNIGDLKAKNIDFNNIAAIVSDNTGNNDKKFIAMKNGWLYDFNGNNTEIILVDGAITDFTGGHDYVFDITDEIQSKIDELNNKPDITQEELDGLIDLIDQLSEDEKPKYDATIEDLKKKVGAPDTETPTLTITPSTEDWTNKDIVLTIIAADNKAVKSITLPDGTAVQGNTASYTIDKNGTYTFIAEDNAGNKTSKDIIVKTIDKTIPTVTISENGTNISVSFSDDLSGINKKYYKIDNNEWAETMPNMQQLKDSKHTIQAKCTDLAGNESEVKSYDFYTSEEAINAGNKALEALTKAEGSKIQEDINNAQQLIDTAKDKANALNDADKNKSTLVNNVEVMQNRLDEVQKAIINSKIDELNKKPDITQEELNEVIDLIDQLSPSEKSKYDEIVDELNKKAVTSDTEAPVLTITPSTKNWTNKDIVFTITATDNKAVKSITLPNSTVVQGNTVSYTVDKNGKYSFIAEDTAGNKKTVEYTVNNIDKTNPIAAITNNSGKISVSFSDDLSGINKKYYKIDNNEWAETMPNMQQLKDSKHTIQAKCTDLAGNESEVKSYDFYTSEEAINAGNKALEALTKAEGSKIQEDINNAQQLIDTAKDKANALNDADKNKSTLVNNVEVMQNRLDEVQKAIDKTKADAEKKAKEEYAEKLVKKAEETKSQRDVDTAKKTVNDLENVAKKDELNKRLDEVQKIIDKIKNDKAEQEKALQAATKLVEKAEKTLLREDYNTAYSAVTALPQMQGKSELFNRLMKLNAAINRKDSEKRVQTLTNVRGAEKLVRKASISKSTEDIAKAQEAINKLPEGKNRDRLQTWLDSFADNTKLTPSLKLNYQRDAERAIKHAEIVRTQETIDAAQDKIDVLPDTMNIKTAYQSRLDRVTIKGSPESMSTLDKLRAAEKAVKRAESNHTVESVTEAEKLVNALPDNDRKEFLQSRVTAEKLMQEAEKDPSEEKITAVQTAIEKLPYGNVKYNLLKRIAAVQKQLK